MLRILKSVSVIFISTIVCTIYQLITVNRYIATNLYYYKPFSFFFAFIHLVNEIDTIMTNNYNFLVKLVTCHATEFIIALSNTCNVPLISNTS